MKKLLFSTVLVTAMLLTTAVQDVVAQSAQHSTVNVERATFKKTPPKEQQEVSEEQKIREKEEAENAKNLKKGQLIPTTTPKTKPIREGRKAKK
jgi:Ni/Co efflux regulator RcnB